jgi:hypothetical protein
MTLGAPVALQFASGWQSTSRQGREGHLRREPKTNKIKIFRDSPASIAVGKRASIGTDLNNVPDICRVSISY